MNIITRFLRANLRGLLIWGASIVAVLAMAAIEFSIYRELSGVDELLESFPESVRALLALDAVRIDQAEGFFSYFAQFLMLVAALYGGLTGAQILSHEVNRKTIETAFPLPVTRGYYIGMKTIGAIINCIGFALIVFGGTVAAFSTSGANPGFAGKVLSVMGVMLLLQVLFLFGGLLVSVLTRRHKRTGMLVASIAVAIYLLTFLVRMSDEMEFLRYLTPFEYFPIVDLMYRHPVDSFGFIAVPVASVVLASLSFAMVRRKDIYI